jgi:hypothetical protein
MAQIGVCNELKGNQKDVLKVKAREFSHEDSRAPFEAASGRGENREHPKNPGGAGSG